jgi:hypothetical protein
LGRDVVPDVCKISAICDPTGRNDDTTVRTIGAGGPVSTTLSPAVDTLLQAEQNVSNSIERTNALPNGCSEVRGGVASGGAFAFRYNKRFRFGIACSEQPTKQLTTNKRDPMKRKPTAGTDRDRTSTPPKCNPD